MTNENKNIFLLSSVFSPTPAYFGQYFLLKFRNNTMHIYRNHNNENQKGINYTTQIDRLAFKNSIIYWDFTGGLKSFVSVHKDYNPCLMSPNRAG